MPNTPEYLLNVFYCNIFSYIKFTEEIAFNKADAHGGGLYFGDPGSFTFHCNYRASTSTSDEGYQVEVRATGQDVENFLTWDNGISINFYSTSDFTTKMNPQSLIVGERFNFELDWEETFTTEMPVRFYPEKCTVTDENTNSFDIIKNGCISNLILMERHKPFPFWDYSHRYAIDILQFSYKSFSFIANQGTFNLKLTCDIKFCLESELGLAADGTGGTCGIPETCPSEYSHGIPSNLNINLNTNNGTQSASLNM